MECIDDTLSVYVYTADSDGSLFNTCGVNDSSDPFRHFKKNIVYRHCHVTKSLDCRLSSLVDTSDQKWTVLAFHFMFSVDDEYRASSFEFLLQNGLSFHACLCPTVIVRRRIHDSSVVVNGERDSHFLLGDNIHKSQSKIRRPCPADIHLGYQVYIKGMIRPLYKLFDMNETSSLQLDSLRGLRDWMLMHFEHFLRLVLMMVQEVGSVHVDGMCHNNIDATAFVVYHVPSPEEYATVHTSVTAVPMLGGMTDTAGGHSASPAAQPCETHTGSKNWGVQLMGQWQCTPCGGVDMVAENSIFRNAKSDMYDLGVLLLHLSCEWALACNSIPESSMMGSPGGDAIVWQDELEWCIMSGECSSAYRSLLMKAAMQEISSVQGESGDAAGDIAYKRCGSLSGFVDILNCLLSKNAYDRPECFEIEAFIKEYCDAEDGSDQEACLWTMGGNHTWMTDIILNEDY